MLLPLGGSTLINANAETHLQELKRISDNISAIIDSERSYADEKLSANREAFVQICEKAGILARYSNAEQ